MFENLIVKSIKPKKVEIKDPKTLSIEIEENKDYFKMTKGAIDYLYKNLGIKFNTSKEVYKLNESIWNNLKDYLITNCKENPDEKSRFELDTEYMLYLIDGENKVVDIYNAKDEENYKEFEAKLEKFTLDITTLEKYNKFYTDGKNGLTKFVLYSKNHNPAEEDYTPVVLLEFNHTKASYKVYTGIIVFKTFTFIPSISPYCEYEKFSDFIIYNDLEIPLNYSEETSADLYKSYLEFTKNTNEISARELISLLKKVGYKLQLKDDNQLDVIDNLTDETSNKEIQNFFNTFIVKTGETAYDILRLSELKKIFRYNQLTLLNVLSILSKEYLTYEGTKITADILGTLVFNLIDKQSDENQVKALKKEVSEN